MNRFGMYLIASVMLLVASCAGSTPPQAQSSPAATDGTQKAGPAPRTPDGHPDFTGVWFPGVVPDIDRYGVTVADHRTFDPKVTPQEPPSFQPWALQKIKLMGDLDLISPGLQCWPGGATAFGLGQVNAIGFVQTPEQLVLLSESETTYRIIYTDGRPHEKDPEPQYHGDSIGHWEGDTLVVDVIGLDTHVWIGGGGHGGWFVSDALHLVERFSRPDANTLIYQVTVEDPKVLTKPWTSAPRRFTFAPGKRLYEDFCTNNVDFLQLNPEGEIPRTVEGNDERFWDEPEYERLRKQFNNSN